MSRPEWMPPPTELDWQEDFGHENGNYLNQCIKCQKIFSGHKRRHVCKKCAEPNWSLNRLYRDDNPTAIPMTPETPSLTKTPLTDAAEHHSSPLTATCMEGMVDADLARALETRALSAEADNARLGSVLERFVKWDKDYPKGTIHSMNGEKALDALFVEAAAILSKP